MKEIKKLSQIFILTFLVFFTGCGKDGKKETTEEDIEFRLETMANIGWKSKRVNQYIEGIN